MLVMPETPIDKKSSRVSNSVLVAAFVSLLFGSNILNTYINTQYHHEIKIAEQKVVHDQDIIDEKKANARRLDHAIEKQDYKNEIKDLTRDLKNCNNVR